MASEGTPCNRARCVGGGWCAGTRLINRSDMERTQKHSRYRAVAVSYCTAVWGRRLVVASCLPPLHKSNREKKIQKRTSASKDVEQQGFGALRGSRHWRSLRGQDDASRCRSLSNASDQQHASRRWHALAAQPSQPFLGRALPLSRRQHPPTRPRHPPAPRRRCPCRPPPRRRAPAELAAAATAAAAAAPQRPGGSPRRPPRPPRAR